MTGAQGAHPGQVVAGTALGDVCAPVFTLPRRSRCADAPATRVARR
ncbi:hypothetical protein [Kitasatospora sp. NPDC056184]